MLRALPLARRYTRPNVAGGAVLAAVAAAALLAPLLAPYDPSLSAGAPLLPPGAAHLLGTNDVGQDVLSELLWGGRASLVVGAAVALLSTTLSWTIGVAAGLWRRAEPPLLAAADLLLALPTLPLYLLIVALAGSGQPTLVLTLGLLTWPAFARIVRAQVLAVRGRLYVEAARALGAGELRRAVVHVLPATFALLPANVVATVRIALVAEATLSFLGLGDPALKSWGTMLGWAFAYPLLFASGAWLWWALPPAVAIALVLVATTLVVAEPLSPATPPITYNTARVGGEWTRSVAKRSPRYTSSGSRPASGATETRSR